jgi:hypothetical protein
LNVAVSAEKKLVGEKLYEIAERVLGFQTGRLVVI